MYIPADKIQRLTRMPKVGLTSKVYLDLPTSRGIYVAFSESGEIFYVGRAENFRARWKNHHRLSDLLQLDPVVLAWEIHPKLVNLAQLEREWIQDLRPRLNYTEVSVKHFSRSINITESRAHWGGDCN